MYLEEESIFSSWDSPCSLGLYIWYPFCFKAAFFLPPPFCQTLDSMPLLQEYSTEKARMLADQVDKPASMLQPNDQYLLIINDAGCYSAQYSV